MRHSAAFLYSTIISLFPISVKRVYLLLHNYYLCKQKRGALLISTPQDFRSIYLQIPYTEYSYMYRCCLVILLHSILSLYLICGGIPPVYVYSIPHLLSLVKCIYVLLRIYYLRKKSTALRRCSKRLFYCNFRCQQVVQRVSFAVIFRFSTIIRQQVFIAYHEGQNARLAVNSGR